MRILFLTTQLPYPPISGGVIKSWNLVAHWGSTQQLQLICLLKNDDANHLQAFKARLPGVDVYSEPVDIPRSAWNLLKSYLFAPTLNVYRNASEALAKQALIWAQNADVIFVDHYEMGQYVPKECKAKVVLHQHNAEYVMWERLAAIEASFIKRTVLKIEAMRIRKAEKEYAKRADLVLAAPNDIEELVKIGVDRKKCEITFHLGDDSMLDLAPIDFKETENCLLFVGTLTWEANVDGLIWFIQEVWPLVKQESPDTLFYIVGKNPDARLTALVAAEVNIILTGFVDDLEPLHKKARAFIIPLRFGSGIKVKLLHALYRGIPVVTTAIGTEGLDVEENVTLYQTSSASMQQQYILTLLNNERHWTAMRDAARKLARKYTWKNLLRQHDESLQKLLRK